VTAPRRFATATAVTATCIAIATVIGSCDRGNDKPIRDEAMRAGLGDESGSAFAKALADNLAGCANLGEIMRRHGLTRAPCRHMQPCLARKLTGDTETFGTPGST
jgi:hypothetical protein